MIRAADMHAAWRELPLGDIETLAGRGRMLILAPHPDDESLGCGGLIAQLCQRGTPPLVVFLTDGTGSHVADPGVRTAALRGLREREAVEALRLLGLREPGAIVFMRLRDAAAPHAGDEFDAAVDQLAGFASGCGTVCATWGSDPHCDHQAADLMARALAARTGIRHLAYPVWGWALPPDTQLERAHTGGWRLDISDTLTAKQAAIAAHRSQQGAQVDGFSDGFTLPGELLAVFAQPFEVFLTP